MGLAIAPGEPDAAIARAGTELFAEIAALNTVAAERSARFARVVARLVVIHIVRGSVFSIKHAFSARCPRALFLLGRGRVAEPGVLVGDKLLQAEVVGEAAEEDGTARLFAHHCRNGAEIGLINLEQ